jgi:hypothetical protein
MLMLYYIIIHINITINILIVHVLTCERNIYVTGKGNEVSS